MTRSKMIRGGLFAAATSAALAFGAVQAFAAPAGQAAARRTCSPQDQVRCHEHCMYLGADTSRCYLGRCTCITN